MYTKSIATVVVWDPSYEDGRSSIEDEEGEGDQVWEDMENAEDDGDGHSDDEGKGDSDDRPSPNSSHKKSRTR